MAKQDLFQKIEEKINIDISDLDKTTVKYNYYKRFCKNFINDLVKIEDKDQEGAVIDFVLWDAQEEALETFQENRLVVVLKARQLGLSWEALSYATHMILFNSGKSVTTISQTENDSKELVRRVSFILKHLPNWLIVNEKGNEEEKSENVTGITYESYSLEVTINHPGDKEASRFKGKTSSPGAARSFTDNLIILDEWAFHEHANKIWQAAFPTINRPTGGQVIGISTGERGTLFEEKWNNADWEFGGESGSGSNLFTGIFLPWDADPRRTQEWYEQTKKALPHTYRAEYPSNPSEAFTIGEGAFFTEWNPKIHVVYDKSWYPPDSWDIVLGYDGGFNRAAAIWFAISNDGWAIAFREYYPDHTTDPEQAEEIRGLSRDPNGVPERIDYIIADTSCWTKNQQTGKSTVEVMEEHGIRPWRQADKDRIMGWRRVHEWLTPIRDEENNLIVDRFGDSLAKLRFTKSMSNTIRLFPSMKEKESNPEDMEKKGMEDHLFDVIRYFCMSRPRKKASKKQREVNRKKREQQIKPRSNVTGY